MEMSLSDPISPNDVSEVMVTERDAVISTSNVKIEFQEESAMAMTVQVLQHVGRTQQIHKA